MSLNTRSIATGPSAPNSDKNQVDSMSAARRRMHFHWDAITDLLGKTPRMRAARNKWLPQEEVESAKAYNVRLNRSFLMDGFGDAIDKVVARPFSRPLTMVNDDSMPEQLGMIEKNADLCKSTLSTVAAQTFRDKVTYGLCFVLVDYPDVEGGLNLAEIRKAKIRPYFTVISPPDLLYARGVKLRSGEEVPVEIRYRTHGTVPDGKFGDQTVETIRVLRAPLLDRDGFPFDSLDGTNMGTWEEWVKVKGQNGQETFTMVRMGTHTYPGIPIEVSYSNKKGFFEAEPPMERLAWKNIEHWQKSSDHNNILRFSRFGILFGSGFSEEEIEKGIVIGPNRFVGSTNKEATLGYVEHTGKAIGAGVDDLKMIEEQMQLMGMEPFMRRTSGGDGRATGQSLNAAKTHSAVQEWIRDHEEFLHQLYVTAGNWIKSPPPEDFKIKIFSEFAISLMPSDDMKIIDLARARKDIDRKTYINEGKRRGLYADSVNVDEIEANLEAEEDLMGFNEAKGDGDENDGENDTEGQPSMTGESNGHKHQFSPGASRTDEKDGHTHTVKDGDKTTGETNGHSHSL